MNKKLAFVLAGGGSRGALEVGALYALLESGLQPDLVVGTSVGAANAALLALNGFSRHGLDLLKAAWQQAARLDLLPSNYIQSTLRAMLGRSSVNPAERIQEFFIQNGLPPSLRFADLKQPQLVVVSADLNTGKPVLHGADGDGKILEALLRSTALPPWNMPVRKQTQYLMDGGILSNLPIEPALRCESTHIVALDLVDSRELISSSHKLGYFLDRLTFAVLQRQVDMELDLARARGVPVCYIDLVGKESIPLWDFHHTDELIEQGYEIARKTLSPSPLFE